jgi:PAS domain-containing protein
MPDQPVHAFDPDAMTVLRGRAASRLTGKAATIGSAAGSADALTVLHAMACSPQTAADALKLLHELQVHQVEVDLQAQELRESRTELESALRGQIELYDSQPVGCFTVDPHSALIALNRAGSTMLGVGHADALGLPLAAFFDADGGRQFRTALNDGARRTGRSPLLLSLRCKGGPERPVLVNIGNDPASSRFLVNLTYAGDVPAPEPALT